MENEESTQPSTQRLVDPRKMGRNNSGLSEADISDVMCILHPCSPAAFSIVATTADLKPQNVLRVDGYQDYASQSVLEEQETFILNGDGPNHAMDLALRLTVETIKPSLGFVFGRNPRLCDIVLSADTNKRVSNMHFSIFMNDAGVLMLRDFSTNGTVVDEMLLKGKHSPQTRMLEPGSIIQILSPAPDEIIKFIVRIPSREGHLEEYESKFRHYMQRIAMAIAPNAEHDEIARRLAVTQPKAQSYKAPIVHNQWGMHWGGGDRYNVVAHIGKGAFATVYQLATKSEGKLFAAKELEKRKFMKNGVLDRKVENEMQIMKAISHPNIVQYVDYQDYANHLYIIMEFVPHGDLQQYLTKYGELNESVGKKMATQVLDSLVYLHSKKITHRDIKPDNILLANGDPEDFTIKLSDFGLSKVVKDNDTFLKTFCGTLLYCAPEVFPQYDVLAAGRGQKRPRKGNAQQPTKFHSYSPSVDTWSFGAVLWYSLCLSPPFEGVTGNDGRDMFERIMMTPLDPTALVKQGVSDDAIAFLVEMLNTDPALRPTPSHCLRHRWFGEQQDQATGGAASPEQGLRAIAEEEENDHEDEPDVSGLSLHEQESSDSQEGHYDEVSIHSDSMNFFDPHQSKRFKSEAFAYRGAVENEGSSSALVHESIPIMHQPDATTQNLGSAQPKLFGEISRSVLNSGVLGLQTAETTQGVSSSHESGNGSQVSANSMRQAQETASKGAIASPSLLGAESLLRDVHMDSAQGPDSLSAKPGTPDQEHKASQPKATPNAPNEITPRPLQQSKFDRQINIPLPASFWYDPNDESTHNLEYASKVSGHDYVANPSFIASANTSLPSTHYSGSDIQEEQHDDTDVEPEAPALLPAPTEFVKPPPRLGRLVSTPDSFAQITINLSHRVSTWGRGRPSTHVYPDKLDTRVPKRGIILFFHARGLEKAPENSDWTKLPDLHCIISTESKQGIFVNGVHLTKGEHGRMKYGRVFTGDEITVCRSTPDGKPGLKFKCEFFHGEGKESRPDSMPRFTVEIERSEANNNKLKTKSGEKENIFGIEPTVA